MTELTKGPLRSFEMTCLRRIMGVSKKDHYRNAEIMKYLHIEYDIVKKIQQRQLRYFGHVTRMKPSRLPYIALHGEVHGHRSVGRPRKRWRENLSDTCRLAGVESLAVASRLCIDREEWRAISKLPTLTLT